MCKTTPTRIQTYNLCTGKISLLKGFSEVQQQQLLDATNAFIRRTYAYALYVDGNALGCGIFGQHIFFLTRFINI